MKWPGPAVWTGKPVEGRNGDLIESLYTDFYDELLARCVAMCHDRGTAEDLVQETFLRALTHVEDVQDLSRGQCRAWLHKTAQRLYIDRVRKLARETAVPLFGERTEITILPDGCAYVGDDAKLDGALIRRYGGKLYINGDLTVNEESAPWLEQVSYLRIHGDARVTRGMYDAFLAVGADYDKEEIVAGKLIQDKLSLTVDRTLLEEAREGLSIADCVNVRFREDVPAELIRERLFSISDCASVVCTPEQRSAVEMAARDVAEIREQLPAGSLVVDLERDQVTSVRGTGEGGILDSLKSLARGKVVNATSYKL